MSQAENFKKEPIFRSGSLQSYPPLEEVELSLGLSLHGRFGVDPTREKGKDQLLTRSSSIPAFLLPVRSDQGDGGAVAVAPARTCSLPAETEEEWRKRKEMQMLRRMEAKRKRSEKQHQQQPPRGLKLPCRGRSGEESSLSEQDNGGLVKSSSGLEGVLPLDGVAAAPSSQGSIGSQGSGSSGLSESESLHAQGIVKTTGSRSSSSAPTPVATTRPASPEGGAVHNGGHNEPVSTKNETNNVATALRSALEEMPRVSTKGLGPDAKRLEGLLYGYRKGEETRILCVCHGQFFTPTEFIKHAGGDNAALAQPLKHIVVDVSPLL